MPTTRTPRSWSSGTDNLRTCGDIHYRTFDQENTEASAPRTNRDSKPLGPSDFIRSTTRGQRMRTNDATNHEASPAAQGRQAERQAKAARDAREARRRMLLADMAEAQLLALTAVVTSTRELGVVTELVEKLGKLRDGWASAEERAVVRASGGR